MKKRSAEIKYSPTIPISTHDAYVDSLVSGTRKAIEPPPVPLTEFGGPEFSIEPVHGARAFDVDKLGRLRGVTYDQVWTPGENEATCRASEGYYGGGAISLNSVSNMYTYMFGGSAGGSIAAPAYNISIGPAKAVKPKGPHSLVGCGCGFYGYYDGSNDYYKPERVSAVVEGYGEVVIGTRGFRATKARIVALTIPETVPFALANRVRHNYRDVPIFESFAEMVTAHPTDTAHGPSPETDPDFWTRP